MSISPDMFVLYVAPPQGWTAFPSRRHCKGPMSWDIASFYIAVPSRKVSDVHRFHVYIIAFFVSLACAAQQAMPVRQPLQLTLQSLS